MNHVYFFEPHPKIFAIRIYDEGTCRLVLRRPVMEVYEHEKTLDKGRFASFSRNIQEHAVALNAGILDWDNRRRPQQMIEWIAEHSTGAWNISIEVNEESLLPDATVFSFAEPNTAVLFQLIFG